MDEGSETTQDIPAFIHSTLKQLISLKSNISSIDDLHNDMKHINTDVTTDITDFANKIKEFLKTLKITVKEIDNKFSESYETFCKEKKANNRKTCKPSSDTDNTNSDSGGVSQEQNETSKLVDDKKENSDSDVSLLKAKNERHKSKNNENIESDTGLKSKTTKSRKKRKDKESSHNILESDVSDSENSKNTDKHNSNKDNTKSDEILESDDSSTVKNSGKSELNNKKNSKTKSCNDSDKENTKNTNTKSKEIEKEKNRKSRATDQDSNNSDLDSASERTTTKEYKKLNKSDSDTDSNIKITKNNKEKENTVPMEKTINFTESDSDLDLLSRNKLDKRRKRKKKSKVVLDSNAEKHKTNIDKKEIVSDISSDVDLMKKNIDDLKKKKKRKKILNEYPSDTKECEDANEEKNADNSKNDIELKNSGRNKTPSLDSDSDSYLEDPRTLIEKSKNALQEKRKSMLRISKDSKPHSDTLADDMFEQLITDKSIISREITNPSEECKEIVKEKAEAPDLINTSTNLNLNSRNNTNMTCNNLNTGTDKNMTNTSDITSNTGNRLNENFKVVEMEHTINSEIKSENKDEEKPKIGLIKCIDISKLLDPKVKSVQKSPAFKNDNTVIILSSSDSETELKPIKIKTPEHKKKEKSEENIRKTRKHNEKLNIKNRENNKKKQTNEETVDTETNDSDVSSDDVKRRTRFNRKKDKLSKEIVKNKFEQFRQLRERRTCVNTRVIKNIFSSSDSDSELSHSSSSSQKVSRKSRNKEQKTKNKIEIDPNYDYKTDIKFKVDCNIILPRIPVENLKEHYRQEKEDAEINRLANMKTLKRTRQQKGTPTSSDNDTKTVKKRSKLQQRKNVSSDVEQSQHSDESHLSYEPIFELETSKKDTKLPIPDDLLDSDGDSNKHSDTSDDEDKDKNKKKARNGDKKKSDDKTDKDKDSADENGTDKQNLKDDAEQSKKDKEKSKDDKENSKEDKEKSNEDDKSTEDNDKSKEDNDKSKEDNDKSKEDNDNPKENKEKSKWRNDPLLRGKLSGTDSEDELIRFRNKKNKIVEDIKSEPEEEAIALKKSKTKKQIKRIARRLGSDISSSEDENEDRKKSDSDKEESDKSYRKLSSDSEEEENTKKKTVRRRIKRIKDSEESSDGDEGEKKEKKKANDEDEQNTRKKIRHVWSKDSLADSTKEAAKEEEERKKRILERQKLYNEIYEKNKLDSNAKVDKVVLDFNEETKEELLSVHPELVQKLKPHQAQGVHFMWTACFESIERAENTEGSGCILAHCMGLGKTLQVITLIHTLLSNPETINVKTVLVVCPLSTVLNWVSEFKKWLDDIDGEQVNVFDLVQYRQNYERLYQMQDWMKFGGVMVMGYDMFRNLSNPKGKRMSKKLINGFNRVLLEPGPDLVVCDEGHLLKNEKTGISIAMNRLRTKRRIVLTGTPLQNNLKEYFCMVQFVKPNLLGTYKEYLNRFVNPITNGQYTDSTPHDIQIMRRRAHVLHKMLDAVVERRDYNVLAPFLPPKHEYVLFITLSEVQSQLYREYLAKFSRNTTVKGTSYLFQDFQELQRICIHPRVLLDKSNQDKLRRDMEDDDSEGSLKDFINDDESDKSSTPAESSSESDSGSDKKASVSTRRTRANPGNVEEEPEKCDVSGDEWWSKFCQGDELNNICHSSKIKLLFDILHQCELIGDKILLFSQSLFSLNLIEYFLAKVDEATQSGDTDSLEKVGGHTGSWAIGLDYFRMDGSTSCENRATWCKTFNNEANSRARLFLISTRAGGLGINLVAANRVIIFDVSWNPSFDIQSIYRVYRFGQTKPCYIYRFVTMGTMENKIYERQVTKQAISKRVIDEQQIDRHYNQTDLAELYAFNPVPDEERPIPLVPKDRLFADLLQSHDKQIFKYHEHNSLLEDKADEGLNEEERRAAWEEFENEKKAPKFNLMQTMVRNGMFETLRILVQEDNNGWTPAQINNILPAVVQRISEHVARGDYSMYRRVEERHEMRVLEQRRMQMIYQQYMQQLRNASGGAPMTPNDMNKLAQMFSAYNQSLAVQQQVQVQPRPEAAGSSSTVSFNQGDPPPQMNAPVPHPAINEVVELND